jgi:hypothetical protein
MTLNEYLVWLEDLNSNKCVLCILEAYNPNLELLIFYISSHTYCTGPNDTPANIQFDVRLSGDMFFTRSIPFFDNGRGVDEYGSVQFTNIDSYFDLWQTYLWKGMRIKILFGDPNWPYANFTLQPILDGFIAERPSFTPEFTEFKIRDKLGKLDVPLQKTLLTSGEKKDEPSPLAFGMVRNIEPIQINDATLKYKWSTGTVDSITTVYDKGVVLAAYTADNANGELTLTNRPTGTVTLDGKGVKSGGVWLSKVGEITKFILNSVGITNSEIDTDALSSIDTDKPYVIGNFITERVNVLDVLDKMYSSIGGFYFFDFFGIFTVGLIQDPSSLTSKLDITIGEIEMNSCTVEPLNDVQWRTLLKYQRNWRVQKDGDLAGSITDPGYPNKARVEWLKNEFRTSSHSDLSVVPQESGVYQYHLVNDPPEAEILLDDATNVATECQARQAILGTARFLVKLRAVSSPFKLLPGDCITIYFDRYGMEEGKKAQILKISYSLLNSISEIEVWF